MVATAFLTLKYLRLTEEVCLPRDVAFDLQCLIRAET